MSSPADLSNRMKAAMKDLAGRAGFDVRIRRDPFQFLQSRGIRTVLDIGANAGQFATHIRSTLPDAKIYSFEPLPKPLADLRKAMGADTQFEAFQLALGDADGVAEFQENDFSAASSLLEVSPASIEAWPFTANTRKIEVTVQTLDHWAAEHSIESPYLLKMDVQGYEDKVIGAGRETVSGAAVVVTEVSFVPIYKGQALFPAIYSQLLELGFALHGMFENNFEPQTGDILSADAIFLPRSGA